MNQDGVMVSNPGKETEFWLPCQKKDAISHLRDLLSHWRGERGPGKFFEAGVVVARYGTATDGVFAPTETIDLTPLGL